ncbi:hypothetical protein GCM10022247_06180 [Allokutzneria multivorans]|uniref:YgiT-type zinc finger domain-containing protein n=1 Tax=Allokutzneria multivorans TaxID=1142134 RepID=A0ABP7QZL1_9PSEU
MTTAPPPSRLPQCELCGGTQVGNLGLVSGHHVGIHPHARTLWARPLSTLNAVVCLQCGHTKFFAADLAEIQKEAREHPERFTW